METYSQPTTLKPGPVWRHLTLFVGDDSLVTAKYEDNIKRFFSTIIAPQIKTLSHCSLSPNHNNRNWLALIEWSQLSMLEKHSHNKPVPHFIPSSSTDKGHYLLPSLVVPLIRRPLHSRSTYATDILHTKVTIYLTWESCMCRKPVSLLILFT